MIPRAVVAVAALLSAAARAAEPAEAFAVHFQATVAT